MNILSYRKFLTLTPFDASTGQGRSDERYRLAALSMGANVLSRSFAMVVMVLTVHLTIPYLGAERFGVWMTIASFVGMLSFLDFGVGNALTNKVSKVAALDDADSLRRTISGGLGVLFIVGCMVSVLLFILANELPWGKIIKVKEAAVSNEISNAVEVFSLLFGLSLFSNGIQRIFSGLQRAFEAHLVNLAGSCFSILFLWILTSQEARIPSLLIATFGTQIMINTGLLLVLIQRGLFTFNNIIKNARFEMRDILHNGVLFFILQIGTMVGWGADSIIIASTLGAAQVAIFSITQQLFQLITQPMAIVNAPLWGAYADAYARKEKTFIKKTLISSMSIAGIYSIGVCIFLLLFGEYLANIWTGNSLQLPFNFMVAYGAWVVLDALGSSFAMFMNGCNIVKPQVYGVLSLVSLSVPVKIFTVNNYGLTGMLTGFLIIYLFNMLFWYGFIFKSEIKRNVA